MKRIIIMLAALALVASFTLMAAAEDYAFTGVKKCGMCHKKPEAGEQLRIWTESAHAKAFTELASEKSLAIAKEMGIGNPQEADECLKCHVTGHGTGDLAAKILPENGVGCESCHGAGGGYYKKATMNGLFTGEIEPASVGLTVIDEATCTACHNEESPTFVEFNYEEALKEIAHPVPAAE